MLNAYNSRSSEFYPSIIDSASSPHVGARPGRGLARLSAPALGVLATLGALMTAAPVLVLLLLALTPQSGADTLMHLVGTVMPRALLGSLLLASMVAVFVLIVGVGTGWLIAAYQFPGRDTLAWALMLPLAMPAFVMAYAYTDFLDTSGPLQTWLRSVTGWSVRGYWFPDIRSLPGAALCLGLALYPYVFWRAPPSPIDPRRSARRHARSVCRHGPPGGGWSGRSPARRWPPAPRSC